MLWKNKIVIELNERHFNQTDLSSEVVQTLRNKGKECEVIDNDFLLIDGKKYVLSQKILGYTIEEHILNPYLPVEITHPDNKDYILAKTNGDFDFSSPKPIRYRHKNGHYIWLEDHTNPIYNEEGRLIALEGISRDVTKRGF